jgi:molecular chaperone Hsp33
VAELLAEMLALAAALSAGLKYEGVFTLQTKGDGPVRLMVADVTSGGDVRGYAQFDAGRLAALKGSSRSVPHLLGAGYLAFTVDQGSHSERYQGLVELTGATLVDCVHHYFRQSEQIPTGIKIAVGREPGPEGAWRAGVLMLQRLPQGSPSEEAVDEATEDSWRRSLSFMASATAAELLDPGLAPNDLLYRLFHEDGVRVFRPADLRAGCRCSRERVTEVLRSLPRAEVKDLMVDGEIVVTCEFCNTRYRFPEAELDALFAS